MRGVPYYNYIDKNTGITVEVQRKIKEIDRPPDKEDIIDVMSIEDFANAEWERLIGGTYFIGDKQKGKW